MDVALAAMFGVVRQIEAACITFDGSRRTRFTLTGHAILTHLAGFGARAAMRRIVGEVETTVDARDQSCGAYANFICADGAGATHRVATWKTPAARAASISTTAS